MGHWLDPLYSTYTVFRKKTFFDSAGLESVPGRNRQTDGWTDRIAIANTRLVSTCCQA